MRLRLRAPRVTIKKNDGESDIIMKPYRTKSEKRRIVRLRTVFLCCVFVIVFVCGCARDAARNERVILCTDDAYAAVLAEYTDVPVFCEDDVPRAWRGKTLFERVCGGAVCQTIDAKALPMIDNAIAAKWAPQYLTTPVIAVDRTRCAAQIGTWDDLLSGDYSVAMDENGDAQRMITSAIGYAHQGADYTTEPGLFLYRQLRRQKRLTTSSADAAVILCLDTDAARMIRAGREMEVIVPRDGTLTFGVGLAANEMPAFFDGLDEALVRAGLRTQNGADETLYPEASAYESAAPLPDGAHFARVTQRIGRDIRRIGYRARLFTSADGLEHQIFGATFCVLLILWVGGSMSCTMDRRIQKTLFFCAAIIVMWVTVRIVKYQVESEALARALWYCYYIFQMILPLGMAHLMILSGDGSRTARWRRTERIMFYAALFFIAAVLTNDLHQKVFAFESLRPWDGSYRYRPLFYVLFGYNLACMLFCVVLLIVKAWDTPRHWRVIYPVALAILTIAYEAAFVAGVPVARESDYTVTNGILFLLYHEAIMLCGLVPVNYGYNRLFAASPLKMQIQDADGNVVLCSAAAAPLEKAARSLALSSGSLAQTDSIVYAAPIPGGAVFWQEDIRALRDARNAIARNVEKLKKTNAMLSGSYAIARRAAAAQQRRQLSKALQEEMQTCMKQTAQALTAFCAEKDDAPRAAGELLFRLCYLKRRCGLFFSREDELPVDAREVGIYLRELAQMASYAGVEAICACDAQMSLTAAEAMLLYDFFYLIVLQAAQTDGVHVLLGLRCETDGVRMEILTPRMTLDLSRETAFLQALERLSGQLCVRPLDDALSVQLTLPGREVTP